MRSYRAWLPKNAILDGVLQNQFHEMVQLWADKWGMGKKDTKVELRKGVFGYDHDVIWSSDDNSVFQCVSPKGMVEIASAILDLREINQNMTSADRNLLEGMALACLEDFHVFLAENFGTSKPVERRQDTLGLIGKNEYIFSLTFADTSRVFEVYMDPCLLVENRKSAVGSNLRHIDLHPREIGVNKQTVRLGAMCGKSQIRVGDLKHLAIGDVIVLDQDIKAEVGLTIDGCHMPDTSCYVIQTNENLSLSIVRTALHKGHEQNGG